jgi:hypothetical protein
MVEERSGKISPSRDPRRLLRLLNGCRRRSLQKEESKRAKRRERGEKERTSVLSRGRLAELEEEGLGGTASFSDFLTGTFAGDFDLLDDAFEVLAPALSVFFSTFFSAFFSHLSATAFSATAAD